ncbi:FAD/NAD(P)-binding protein [Actinoplanes sichuanensis]|uniref:FAD/NAD(P)-binding protein n=1 Tax=Actinoplanes sichuanensis TaxID=512349 RepID=A0ABW4AVP4_9ACTN|nr:FAD/NAD(P)-binding protein [Actinoplanes sichuanensis]BEL07070.1 FAD/NAD(P)-binding protein [Actinoplanes sichuanensis]
MTSVVARNTVTAAATGRHRNTVAIIGGGFSGALAAAAITRNPAWRTVLISPEERPGRGVAYGAAEPWHLLNSRVATMSADPADPKHLLRWCRTRGLPADAATFLPRAWYGDYLSDHLAAAASAAGSRLVHHRSTAVEVRPEHSGYTITDANGCRIHADQVILALGNPPPSPPSAVSATARRSPAFVADPWIPGALTRALAAASAGAAAVPSGTGAVSAGIVADAVSEATSDATPGTGRPASVLLLGTGLTAIDVALTINEQVRGVQLEALSRRGLLPRTHPQRPAPAVDLALPEAAELGPLLRRVRAAVAEGADWTAVVEYVRHHADRLWNGLNPDAQERFLRHVQRYWEVHRHRMAPPIAARITRLREQGTLRIRSGRLLSIEPDPRGGLLVHIEGEAPRRYAAVISCTGPAPLPSSAGPLLSDLLAAGLVETGPHGLGLESDPDGRIRTGLWLVGPLRRGRSWESTAVPEIRSQIERLVAALPQPAPAR